MSDTAKFDRQPKDKKKPRRGIQSVGIGMRVLSAVAGMRGPSALSAIARIAELSPSQTHRYISSLMGAGMVKQTTGTGLYDLDSGAIRIGLAALSRIDVFSSADRFLRTLAEQTRRSCLLAVWGDAGPTIVRWYPGSPPVITVLGVGSVLPFLRSATGRIFHAFGDREEMDRQVRILGTSDPSGIPTDCESGREIIRRTLSTSLSGDLIPGLRAVSAPAFDLQGRLVLVATLVATSSFPTSGDAAARRELLETCRLLTESLGGTWPAEHTPKARARRGSKGDG
jgi:DNA-binding IclR family transcriptional regulator